MIAFFLNFKCETAGCDPNDFEIMNEASKTSDKQIADEDIKNNFDYDCIRANLQTNLNLREFPFDKHMLAIELEDKTKTATILSSSPIRNYVESIRKSMWQAGHQSRLSGACKKPTIA